MVGEIQVKSILNKHKKRDDWFLDDYSVNPYSSCSFNCIYCYVRGSRYGENMTGTLSAKVNLPEILEKQLSRRARRGEYGVICIASSTEPYMPVEEEFKLTRISLEIIARYRFPVRIVTKSKLVLRDLDILGEIGETAILPADLRSKLNQGVMITFSISTLDERLAKTIEPGAPPPVERLEAMKECGEEGFLTGVCYAPTLPFISDGDEELDIMIETAKDYGAKYVFVGTLTLFGSKPSDSRTLYFKFLERYFPELLPKYESLYRSSFEPPKEYQRELEERSRRLCVKYGVKHGIV